MNMKDIAKKMERDCGKIFNGCELKNKKVKYNKRVNVKKIIKMIHNTNGKKT